MKPKSNYNQSRKDLCQTPPYAIDPLLTYIERYERVWEPACGEGYLADLLFEKGYTVIRSDILYGHDFLIDIPSDPWDLIVTNPPYNIKAKYGFIQRCYELGNPFALLMSLETLGAAKAQKNFKRYGMELLVLNKRVNFKMPNKGWKDSSAQFPVGWFTSGLNIGRDITYCDIQPESMQLSEDLGVILNDVSCA